MTNLMHQNDVSPKPGYMMSIREDTRPRRCLAANVEATTFYAGFFQRSLKNQNAQRAQHAAKHISTTLRAVAEASGFPEHPGSVAPLLTRGSLQICTATNRFK